MKIAQLPTDEEMRLQDLFSYNILDTDAEKEFDELVELAAQICNCPVSIVTFLDDKRTWFKASIGFDGTETPKDISFCSHAIKQNEVMIVEDATKDERFKTNPLVYLEKPVRFYAGAPIVSPAGYNLGALCVVDHKPNVLSKEQSKALTILSNQVTQLLELRMKNQVIRKRAEQIIELKEQTTSLVIQEHEEQKQQIANRLHEKLAQQVAAVRLYIGLASESENDYQRFLSLSDALLEGIVQDIKNLSVSISPSLLHNIPVTETIADYLHKISQGLPFKINYRNDHHAGSLPFEMSILLFRIIEKWISILKMDATIQQVSIEVSIDEKIHVHIKDDSTAMNFAQIEQEIMKAMIDTRVNFAKGQIHYTKESDSTNLLQIEIPMHTIQLPTQELKGSFE